ncbi:MAG: tetratricopeptide repeat protein [Nitrospinota bacterium]
MCVKKFKIDFHLAVPFLLAILLPLLHLASISGTPAFDTPIIDSGEYVQVAKEIVASSFAFTGTDHLSALYAWVLGFLFFVSGSSLVAVKVVQIGLNAITLVLFFYTAKKSFSRKTALVASYIWAFYGPIIFFTCEIISVSFILFFYVLSLFMLVRAKERNTPAGWLATGMVFGLAAQTRPEILGFSSIILLSFAFSFIKTRPFHFRPVVNALLFGAALAGPLLLTGINNKRVYGAFSMLPTASGVNFYMGNNPDFKKSIGSRPGPYWDSLSDLPLEEDSIGNSFVYERNYFFYNKVATHALEHPFQYLEALVYKVRTLVNGYELPAVFSIYESRSSSPVLSLLTGNVLGFFLPFACIFPLTLIGIAVNRKKWGEQRWILIMWISFFLPLIGYWNSGRFRMVIIPFVILYASEGILSIYTSLKKREKGRFRTKAALAVFLTFLLNTTYFHFSRNFNFRAEALTFTGAEKLFKDGSIEDGVALLDQSLEVQKRNDKRCSPIGFIKNTSRDCTAILQEHHATLKALTYSYKGDAMMLQKKYKKAIDLYGKAVQSKPDFSVALNNMGAALLNINQIDKAFFSFQKALEIKPHNAFAHKNLGNILTYKNKTEEAIYHFNEALKIAPFDAECYFRLGKVYEQMGRKREAAENYMMSLKIREL